MKGRLRQFLDLDGNRQAGRWFSAVTNSLDSVADSPGEAVIGRRRRSLGIQDRSRTLYARPRGCPGGGPGGPRMMNPLRSAIGASFATFGGGPSW